MKVWTTKKFDGKTYKHYNWTRKKANQKEQIAKLKAKGYSVRTSVGKGYHGYGKMYHIWIKK